MAGIQTRSKTEACLTYNDNAVDENYDEIEDITPRNTSSSFISSPHYDENGERYTPDFSSPTSPDFSSPTSPSYPPLPSDYERCIANISSPSSTGFPPLPPSEYELSSLSPTPTILVVQDSIPRSTPLESDPRSPSPPTLDEDLLSSSTIPKIIPLERDPRLSSLPTLDKDLSSPSIIPPKKLIDGKKDSKIPSPPTLDRVLSSPTGSKIIIPSERKEKKDDQQREKEAMASEKPPSPRTEKRKRDHSPVRLPSRHRNAEREISSPSKRRRRCEKEEYDFDFLLPRDKDKQNKKLKQYLYQSFKFIEGGRNENIKLTNSINYIYNRNVWIPSTKEMTPSDYIQLFDIDNKIEKCIEYGGGNVFQVPNFFDKKKLKLFQKQYIKKVSDIIKGMSIVVNKSEKVSQLGELNVLYYKYDRSYIYMDLSDDESQAKVGYVDPKGNPYFIGFLDLSGIHHIGVKNNSKF